jgi:hypothetical protein
MLLSIWHFHRWMNTRVAKYMDGKANTGMFDSDGDESP